MPKTLRWTNEKPTEPGYYWIAPCDGDGTLIRYVCYTGYGDALDIDGIIPMDRLPDDFRFAGPIPEPGREKRKRKAFDGELHFKEKP